MLVKMHRETVKAAIRIKHGSLAAFAIANGLSSQSVRDFLRGQSSRAKDAVAALLGVDPAHLVITGDSTVVEAPSKASSKPHRLNAGAR